MNKETFEEGLLLDKVNLTVNKHKFYAVLHAPPVKSAQGAVTASIAKDYGG